VAREEMVWDGGGRREREQAERKEMIGKKAEQYWDIPSSLTMAANSICVPMTGTPVQDCG
jgi:hypothetical protein